MEMMMKEFPESSGCMNAVDDPISFPLRDCFVKYHVCWLALRSRAARIRCMCSVRTRASRRKASRRLSLGSKAPSPCATRRPTCRFTTSARTKRATSTCCDCWRSKMRPASKTTCVYSPAFRGCGGTESHRILEQESRTALHLLAMASKVSKSCLLQLLRSHPAAATILDMVRQLFISLVLLVLRFCFFKCACHGV